MPSHISNMTERRKLQCRTFDDFSSSARGHQNSDCCHMHSAHAKFLGRKILWSRMPSVPGNIYARPAFSGRFVSCTLKIRLDIILLQRTFVFTFRCVLPHRGNKTTYQNSVIGIPYPRDTSKQCYRRCPFPALYSDPLSHLKLVRGLNKYRWDGTFFTMTITLHAT